MLWIPETTVQPDSVTKGEGEYLEIGAQIDAHDNDCCGSHGSHLLLPFDATSRTSHIATCAFGDRYNTGTDRDQHTILAQTRMAVVRDIRYASRTLPGSDCGERRLCRAVTGAAGKNRREDGKSIAISSLARMRTVWSDSKAGGDD